MKTLRIVCFLFLVSLPGISQTLEIQDFNSHNPGYVLALKKNDMITGYLRCYIDNSDDMYHLSKCDENLGKEISISLEKKWNKFVLISIAYNGSHIGLYFYDRKQENYVIVSYDENLKSPFTAEIPEETMKGNRFYVSQIMVGSFATELGSEQVDRDKEVVTPRPNMKLVPVEGKGFIVQGLLKSVQGSIISLYNNQMKLKWKYQTVKEGKDIEEFVILGSTDKVLYGVKINAARNKTRNFDYSLFALDLETGKVSLDVPIQSKIDNNIQITNVLFRKETGMFHVFGEFGVTGAAYDTPNHSKGFFMKIFDGTGKETTEKFFSLDKDVAGKLDAAGKKFLKERFRTYVHSILPGKDGRLFLVTEQFRENYGRRTVRTPIGATGQMQPSTETYVKMITVNIAIYEMGEDYSLVSARIFQKKEDLNVQPEPFAKLDIFIVAQMAATLRQYDFLSVQSVKGSGYVLSFRDRDSEITRILHLRLDSDGKMEMKKAEYPSIKKFECRVYPAKDGYVMKLDFSKSKKQASLSLQPVNQ